MVAGNRDKLLARLGLHIGGIHDGEAPCLEAHADDVMQQLECGGCRGLIVLIIGH